MESSYYHGGTRFNLREFWAEHKNVLPLHFAAYVAEVAPVKPASANVESTFSGAGKFTDEVQLAFELAQPAVPAGWGG